MKQGFHPVFDNPVRMAYVPGWERIDTLVERLKELESEVVGTKVIPAVWEPFHQECPCCRNAAAYAWSRSRLQNPRDFAVHLALFPGEGSQLGTPIGRANWLMLATKREPSHITRRLMLAEALDLWETSAHVWLREIVERCAGLGIETSAELLHPQVQPALDSVVRAVLAESEVESASNAEPGSAAGHGFDRELLHMAGWTQDPGTIILPVDGVIRSMANEILLLNLQRVALLRGRKIVRSVAWDQVTLVYVLDGAVTFDISSQRPLVVAGFKHPEEVLETAQECYRTATERMLQALATQVTRITP